MIGLSNGFYAKVNKSGTHIHKDFLKVRVDIYPDVESKTYHLHYVDKLDRLPTEEEMADKEKFDLIPTHKELNPCLCHFITVNPKITKKQLVREVQQLFTTNTISRLDSALSTSNSLLVNQIMQSKSGNGRKLGKNYKASAIISQVNTQIEDI